MEGSRGSPEAASYRRLPFLSPDASLPQKSHQQVHADVSSMGARQDEPTISPQHELVPTACRRAFKAQLPQAADQLAPRDWRETRHSGGCLLWQTYEYLPQWWDR